MTDKLMTAIRRFRRVMVAVEIWLWPIVFGAELGDYDGLAREANLHLGIITLRLRWCFAEEDREAGS